jgi:hypothetical protein
LGAEAIDNSVSDLVIRGRSCLVGKLMADRIIGKDAIKSTLIKGWKPSGMTCFKVLGDNLFLIDFEHSWDKVSNFAELQSKRERTEEKEMCAARNEEELLSSIDLLNCKIQRKKVFILKQ